MATVDPSLVANLPLFAEIGGEELAEILREARSVRYARNSTIFAQGLLLHGHLPPRPRRRANRS